MPGLGRLCNARRVVPGVAAIWGAVIPITVRRRAAGYLSLRLLNQALSILLSVTLFVAGQTAGGTLAVFTDSKQLSGTITTGSVSGVTAPTLTQAHAHAGGSIHLEWTSVAGVAGYNVFRSITSGSGYVQIAVLGDAPLEYTDTATSDGVRYFYVVRSRGSDGTLSANSNQLDARADATAPTVASVTPSNGITNVAVNAKVLVTFGEAMKQPDTAATFQLTGGSTTLTCSSGGNCTWSTDGKTLSFDPTVDLQPNTTYTVQITTPATLPPAADLAGNAFNRSNSPFTDVSPCSSTAYCSRFTTSSSTTADTTAPTIISRSPASGATNVGTNTDIVVGFSEAMDPGSTEAAFCLYLASGSCAANRVSGTFVWSNANSVLTFDVSGLLSNGT